MKRDHICKERGEREQGLLTALGHAIAMVAVAGCIIIVSILIGIGMWLAGAF